MMAFGIIPMAPSNRIRSYGDIVDGVDDTSSLNPVAVDSNFDSSGNYVPAAPADTSSWLDQYGVSAADIGPQVYNANTPVSVNTADPTTTPANQQAWGAVTNLITSTLTNVAQPAINNLINSSVYGQPAYYITTKDGKQAPVWKAADGRFFTIDASGAQTFLPATPAAPPGTKAAATSSQWIMMAAIGAAALLLITVVLKRK